MSLGGGSCGSICNRDVIEGGGIQRVFHHVVRDRCGCGMKEESDVETRG